MHQYSLVELTTDIVLLNPHECAIFSLQEKKNKWPNIVILQCTYKEAGVLNNPKCIQQTTELCFVFKITHLLNKYKNLNLNYVQVLIQGLGNFFK